MTKSDEIEEWLKSDGWEKYEADAANKSPYWCKQFLNAPSCICNDNRPGIQVVITKRILIDGYGGVAYISYKVDIRGEFNTGYWCDLNVYSVHEDYITEMLPFYISKLIKAWTAMRE